MGEWQEWEAHPVTKWYREAVERMLVESRTRALKSIRATCDETAMAIARTVGYAEGLSSAYNVAPESVEALR